MKNIPRIIKGDNVVRSKKIPFLDGHDQKPLDKVPLKGKKESQKVFELVRVGGGSTRIKAATAKATKDGAII
jgi:hypothetical protein